MAIKIPADTATYRVVRFYQAHPRKVIETGLSLEDAQAHCKDPETSSSTATSPEALAHTAAHGEWFDGWEEDE